MTPAEPRRFDLLAIGDPVTDVVLQSGTLPRWDDKHLVARAEWLAGGSEANAACAAARLGLQVAVLGTLGDGAAADLHRREFAALGICMDYLFPSIGTMGALAIVYVGPGGERAVSYVPAKPHPESEVRLEQAAVRARCLYTLPYDVQRLRHLADVAHRAGGALAVDVERAVVEQPGMPAALLDCADILCFNESGFRAMTAVAPTLDTLTRLLLRSRASLLSVSRGAQGAMAVDRSGACVDLPAWPVGVVDTTGAGDAFNAAIVSGWLQGLALARNVRRATLLAASCVESRGARHGLMDAAKLERLMAQCMPGAHA